MVLRKQHTKAAILTEMASEMDMKKGKVSESVRSVLGRAAQSPTYPRESGWVENGPLGEGGGSQKHGGSLLQSS